MKRAILQTFKQLVSLDSTSKNEQQVASYIIKRLKKLGLKPKQDKIGNFIALSTGVQNDHSVDEQIAISDMVQVTKDLISTIRQLT